MTQTPHDPLPPPGPEVAHHLSTVAAPPGELCEWLCAQAQLHLDRYHAPLVNFRIEDPEVLHERDRTAALWEHIIAARGRGELAGVRLTLEGVRPRPAPASWFALAARAGVAELVLDVGARSVNELFPLLTEVCVRAHDHEIMPRIPLPLLGTGLDPGEPVIRAVVILKGALPWQPVPADVPPEVRGELGPALAAAVAEGTADPVLLADLVLGPWFQRLPPADRRALFPVWLAAYTGKGRDEAVAAVHPYLRPAVTAWLSARQDAAQIS